MSAPVETPVETPAQTPDSKEILAQRKVSFWERTDYDRAFRGSFGQYMTDVEREALERMLGQKTFKQALDLGCGHGRFLRWLSTHADRLVGLDRSHRLLKVGQEWLGEEPLDKPTELTYASATELPYADGSFDGITCVRVIQHVPDQDLAMREISRVLSDDGDLILVQYNYISPHGVIRAIKIPIKAVLRFLIRMTGGEPKFDERTLWTCWPLLKSQLRRNGLEPEAVTGAWMFPLQYFRNRGSNNAWPLFGPLARVWELFARLPLTKYFGGYLICRCRPIR